jgi:hypothetical protein
MTLRPGPAPAGPRRRSHLRLALATGVPFAVLWGAWFALAGTLPPGPGGLGIIAVAAVVAGVFFGRAMSLVLGGEQLRGERRALDPVVTSRPGVASATIPVGVPAAQVLRHGAEAAATLPRAELTSVDTHTGTLVLRVGMSWLSWGERIGITAPPRFRSATDVTITSRSVVPWTLVDYGVNARNVERLAVWARNL